METILNQIREVFNNCLALQSDFQNKVTQANDVAAKQKDLAEKQAKREQNLNEREANLEKIEDLIQYRKDSSVRMEQAQGTINDFHARATNFTAYEDAVKKELQARADALEKRETEISKKEANLESLILEKVRSVLKR